MVFTLSPLKAMLYMRSAHQSLRPGGHLGNGNFDSEIKFEGGDVF